MAAPLEIVLFAFLVALAVAIARMRHLFAAAMLTGIFTLVSAGLFTLMDAVDVAFTEAAVGAGISTILLLGTLALTGEDEAPGRPPWLALAIVLATGAALVYGTLDMPRYGDPGAPIHQHVAPRYLERTPVEIGVPNVVTAVLASYRGFDTLGELTVILTAGAAVLLLLGSVPGEAQARPRPLADGERRLKMRMREKMVLRVVAKRLVPFVLLFALYVQFHGDFGPGGGFQAGVIFAAGFILFAMIFGLESLQRVAPPALVLVGIALGALLFAGVGVAAMLRGASFLDYGALVAGRPLQGQHLGILLIELGVGVTVASVMLAIYYAFAGRRDGAELAP